MWVVVSGKIYLQKVVIIYISRTYKKLNNITIEYLVWKILEVIITFSIFFYAKEWLVMNLCTFKSDREFNIDELKEVGDKNDRT